MQLNRASAPTNRRQFIARALSLASYAFAPWEHLAAPALRIALIADARDVDRHRGALLGIEEAEHAARLFGGTAELVPVAQATAPLSGVTAVIGTSSLSTTQALTSRASREGFIVMNVECTSDVLRGDDCSPRLFHVAPSDAMLRDARAQLPGARDVVAWDATLVRFGADTLNDRFRARFGASMTPASWAAWFAVKAVWESSLRMKSVDAAQIAEYLTRDTTQFDGHKGRPLSFRPWDHQLRQFLYGRVDGKPVDIPRTASPEATSHEVLDALGASAATTACHVR